MWLIAITFSQQSAGCLKGELQCGNTTQCISNSSFCNGTSECENGYDESFEACGRSLFTMRNQSPYILHEETFTNSN